MKILLFMLLLIQQLDIYSIDSPTQLEQKLIQMRVDYYEDNLIPSSDSLVKILEQIDNITDNYYQLRLNTYYGIIVSELLIYSVIDTNHFQTLKELYKYSSKMIKKSKDSSIYVNMGDWAILMTRLDKDNEKNYALDARMSYLYALTYDKKNINATIGLGKWWAWNVISGNNREMNHSFSQAERYLSETNITQLDSENNLWNSIDVSQIYVIRSLLRMRMLQTNLAYQDLWDSIELFPQFNGNITIQHLYAKNIVKWN